MESRGVGPSLLRWPYGNPAHGPVIALALSCIPMFLFRRSKTYRIACLAREDLEDEFVWTRRYRHTCGVGCGVVPGKCAERIGQVNASEGNDTCYCIPLEVRTDDDVHGMGTSIRVGKRPDLDFSYCITLRIVGR